MVGVGGVRAASTRRWRAGAVAGTAMLALSAALGWSLPAISQTLSERLAASTKNGERAPLLVDADQMIYDNDKNRVIAVGPK